jgi:hypothetical protein
MFPAKRRMSLNASRFLLAGSPSNAENIRIAVEKASRDRHYLTGLRESWLHRGAMTNNPSDTDEDKVQEFLRR